MELIDINLITVPEHRQRKAFPPEAMDELAMSIMSKGLMHPPVVRNDGVTLVAGERRLRAILSLQEIGLSFDCHGARVVPGTIPVTRLAALSPLEIREAELEENVIRLDLTWQERAAAIAELHDLRSEQAELEGKVQTVSDTAQEVYGAGAQGGAITSTNEALLVKQHLANPEVAKAKSQKEAMKVIRKLAEAEHRAKLAATFDLTKTEHTILNVDMSEAIKTLPDASFDCILTDPPYGVEAANFGSMASTGHNYEDSWESALELYKVLAVEGYRVAKPEAHLYTFCDILNFQQLALEFSLAGWRVWPKPLIWDKGNGMLPRPEHGPRYSYEAILFASKGDKTIRKVANDVLRFAQDSELMHGAQKPVELYVELLERSVLPGNAVLDPFAGSGTILSAASATRCVATAIEKLPANYAMCLSRLATPDVELPA